MGLKLKRDIKWNEGLIQDTLNKNYLSTSTKKYQLNNLFVFNWESDYLCITNSGIVHEIEIKISREDFFNDFKNKREKHLLLESETQNENVPNFFFYCVPEKLIDVDETPEYAGLIYVINEHRIEVVKDAPKINRNKVILEDLNLTDKFYYNMVKWRENALKNYKEEIELLKEEKRLSKVDSDGKKYKYTLKEAHERLKCFEYELETKEQQINFYSSEYHYFQHNLRRAEKLLKENGIDFQRKERGEN